MVLFCIYFLSHLRYAHAQQAHLTNKHDARNECSGGVYLFVLFATGRYVLSRGTVLSGSVPFELLSD